MKTIAAVLRELVEPNTFFQFGLANRLLNLSQLARYLRPQVEARLKKSVELSAVTMNLSRLQRESAEQRAPSDDLRISNIVVHSQLSVLAYPKRREVHAGINRLYNKLQRLGGYITICEGISEVAIIIDSKNLRLGKDTIEERPAYEYSNVASLGVKFDPSTLDTPGLYHSIFQQLYFQRINIIELASAATELIIYIAEEDVQLAFDTLYQRTRSRAKG